MSDEEDTADTARKSSRRDRFKGAIARTKTKLSKKDKDAATTVDDFLATGSAGRPSISDTLSIVSDRPSTTQSHYHDINEHQSTAAPVPPPQSSPRRIIVPKIDVSTSQRYPGAQPLQYNNERVEPSLLRPEYQARSRSNSSLAKGRGRARGLSVQFVDRPPIIIGEGGDEAEAPPIEVGKTKARARSASPPRSNGGSGKTSNAWHKKSLQYFPRPTSSSPKPLLQQAQHRSAVHHGRGSLSSPGLKRIQTGMIGATPSPISESRQAIDKEFDMSLGMSPASTVSTAHTISPTEPPLIHAPTPIRPPVSVPNVQEMPLIHDLKGSHGIKSLRDQFTQGGGIALRETVQNEVDHPPSAALNENFTPAPGPPPGWQPPHEEIIGPPGPPPPVPQPTNGYRSNQPPVISANEPLVLLHPPFHSASPAQPLNGVFTPPGHSPSQILPTSHYPPPAEPAIARPAPDEDYTGWVRDGAAPDAKVALAVASAVATPQFPGVDSSGKLKPFFDNDHDAKPEKTKKRWFRRGS